MPGELIRILSDIHFGDRASRVSRLTTNLNDLPRVNHHLELTAGGVLENECRDLLQAFFRLKRAEE